MTNPKVNIGFDIEWALDRGLNLWAGVPTLSMWIPTTVAGLMAGMVEMVGVERFNLCLQLGGQQSVDGDWAIISSAPTFEEGLVRMTEIAWPAGWGRWELVSLDRERREVRYRVKNGWEALYQQALNVSWGSAMVAGKLAGITSRLLGTPCWAEQTSFAATGAEYDEFIVRPTDTTMAQRLDQLLAAGQGTNADLAVALQKLRLQMEERARAEQDLRDKLTLIQEQEVTLRTLSAPILQVWNKVLAVPIMGGLDDQGTLSLRERLLGAIAAGDAEHVILDLTAVEWVDTSTANRLIRIARAVELLGASVIITGIRASVSETFVTLGIDLGGLRTLRNLQEGIRACMSGATKRDAMDGFGRAREVD